MRFMLDFKPVTPKTIPLLRRYYESCAYRLCEYSVGLKLMWAHALHCAWAEEAGCLLIRSRVAGRYAFDYPVPLGEEADLSAALDAVDAYCAEEGCAPRFMAVPRPALPALLLRYPRLRMDNFRPSQDYLYRAEDLAAFAGRRYSGQRNHINKFRKACPEARFRVITPEDREELEAFWEEFHQTFHKENATAQKELCYARAFSRLIGEPWVLAGALELEGRFIAIAIGEICGDTLHCHIEKALTQYEGVYPTMVQAFSAQFGGTVQWINREDDSGDPGLRTSKLQYLPADMGEKYLVEAQNELHSIARLPVIHTPRLTLDPLTPADVSDYNRLCLDDERNRWWGYDYRKDLRGALTEKYFLNVARRDFRNRTAANLAIRLDGRLIGEIVLYHFDYKGGAELGCRILPEFAGQGYGAEAFAAAADWSLYSLGLFLLRAKCFKENTASHKMLSARMRPAGEDETYFYFERKV